MSEVRIKRNQPREYGTSSAASPTARFDRRHVGLAALFVALALGVTLFRLGMPSLWFDEAFTWRIVARDWAAFWRETTYGEDCGGFLYSLIVKLWTSVAGTGEFALRAPNVVFAVGLGLVLLQIGKELHSLRAGFFMALFGVVHPQTIIWMRQARAYGFELFLTAVYILILLRYARAFERKQGLLSAGVGTLLCLTHIFGVFVVAGAGLYLLWRQFPTVVRDVRTQRFFAPWPTLVPLPPLIGWVILMRGRINQNLNDFWIQDSLRESYATLIREFSALVAFVAVCALVGAWRLLARKASAQERTLLTTMGCLALFIFAGPFVVSLFCRGTHHFILTRYHMPGLALLFVVAGYYAARLPLKPTLIAAAALCAFAFREQGLVDRYGTQGPDGSFTREAVAYLREHRRPGDKVLIAPFYETITASYYGVAGPETWACPSVRDVKAAVDAPPPEHVPAPGGRTWVLLIRSGEYESTADFGLPDAPQESFGATRILRVDSHALSTATHVRTAAPPSTTLRR